jgi:group I intron endonuclease
VGFIYKATNNINKKVYIGKTTRTLKDRKKEHISHAKSEDYYFHNALRKYGAENFTWEIIEEVELDKINERECYWIEYYKSYKDKSKGYNLTPGGEGFKLSEETKRKISAANAGKVRTPEMRQHLSEVKKALHFRHTEETKKKMSAARRGRKLSPETIEKLKQIERTSEWREKISKALKGRTYSEETKIKMSEAAKDHFTFYTSNDLIFHTWGEIFRYLKDNNLITTDDIAVCRNCIRPAIDNLELVRYGMKWKTSIFTEEEKIIAPRKCSEKTKKKIGAANSNKNEIVMMIRFDGDKQEFASRREAYDYCIKQKYIPNTQVYSKFSSKIGEASKTGNKFKGMNWIIKQKDVETIEK